MSSVRESIIDNIEESGEEAYRHSKKGYLVVRKLKNEDNDRDLSAIESLERIRQHHDNENLRELEEHLNEELDAVEQVLGKISAILGKLIQDDKTFDEQDLSRLAELIQEEEEDEEMAERISYELSEEEKDNLEKYKSKEEHEVLKLINSDITKLENSLEGIERHVTDMLDQYERLNNL